MICIEALQLNAVLYRYEILGPFGWPNVGDKFALMDDNALFHLIYNICNTLL